MKAIVLLLLKSETAMEDLMLWIQERNPELKKMSPEQLAEIMEQAVTLHDTLPKELQTAEALTEK